jgi:hypothetical protein
VTLRWLVLVLPVLRRAVFAVLYGRVLLPACISLADLLSCRAVFARLDLRLRRASMRARVSGMFERE